MFTMQTKNNNDTLMLRTFLRFIRENKVLNRYKTDIAYYYLNTWGKFHILEQELFIKYDFNISKFLYGRTYYLLPIDRMMTWQETRSCHKFWSHVNSDWKFYWGSKPHY